MGEDIRGRGISPPWVNNISPPSHFICIFKYYFPKNTNFYQPQKGGLEQDGGSKGEYASILDDMLTLHDFNNH